MELSLLLLLFALHSSLAVVAFISSKQESKKKIMRSCWNAKNNSISRIMKWFFLSLDFCEVKGLGLGLELGSDFDTDFCG